MKRIAEKQDKVHLFHKIPVSQQSLVISELVELLEEDYPVNDERSITDKLLKIIALHLTEHKFPILDKLKNHEMPE